MNTDRPATSSGTAVLGLTPLDPGVSARLRERGDAVVLPADSADLDAFLAARGDDVRALVCSGTVGAPAALLRRMPSLGAVVVFGAGVDAVDIQAADALGVQVSNTPDVLSEAVADTALYLHLETRRRFADARRLVADGEWARGTSPSLTDDAHGRRVGILGMGRIGEAVARRMAALGCEVHYCNRRPVEGSPHRYHADPMSLAGAVETLVVAVSGGPGTRGLVGAEVLERLGAEGVLINMARGSVVNEDALVRAVQEDRLGAVGLDVYEDEPHVPRALVESDRVVALPHVGSATTGTRRAMRDLVVENLERYLADGVLVTPVGMAGLAH
ncbi:2-hydroxyacid dehydrogenase [Micrococcus sp. HG099]|uniref:2-hydroxyacid dehydrogenase n=1 Tax=Micrococcus sp. HG099 TaxID=2969755 RepID=UPI00215B2A98|nr:2-hydroxyacid dehydrogenase [Micrococcus sp. HG099]